jgi:hypothetical protein
MQTLLTSSQSKNFLIFAHKKSLPEIWRAFLLVTRSTERMSGCSQVSGTKVARNIGELRFLQCENLFTTATLSLLRRRKFLPI